MILTGGLWVLDLLWPAPFPDVHAAQKGIPLALYLRTRGTLGPTKETAASQRPRETVEGFAAALVRLAIREILSPMGRLMIIHCAWSKVKMPIAFEGAMYNVMCY